MKPRKIPQRMCVGCQEMRNKKELIRVVRTPEGEIDIDPTGKKAGRGAYLCNCCECLSRAVKERRLERALRHCVAPEIYDKLRLGLKVENDNG